MRSFLSSQNSSGSSTERLTVYASDKNAFSSSDVFGSSGVPQHIFIENEPSILQSVENKGGTEKMCYNCTHILRHQLHLEAVSLVQVSRKESVCQIASIMKLSLHHDR